MNNLNLTSFTNRFLSRILTVIIISILAFGYFFTRPNNTTYMVSVGVKVELQNIISFSNPSLQPSDDILKGISSEVAYTQLTPILSKYLFTQVSSIPFQYKFLSKIGEPIPPTIDKKLVYDVIDTTTPYIYINYRTSDKVKAQKASIDLKQLLVEDIANSWNVNKPDKYKISVITNPEEVIVEQPGSIVSKLMPAIYIIIGLILLALLVPDFKTSK
jgi:hypothetical protein